MTNSPPCSATDGIDTQLLQAGWQLTATTAGACTDIEQLSAQHPAWRTAIVPGTVAMSLGADFNTIGNYDAEDWWYRCNFSAPAAALGAHRQLRFDGLATLAEIWLNGTLIFKTRNMFVAHSCDVTKLLRNDNELVICFRALHTELAARKPRPRWKTALVNQQNLRWVRTTLLGRISSWTPPLAPVGPWRPIALLTRRPIAIDTLDIQTSANDDSGYICVAANLVPTAQPIHSAAIHIGAHRYDLTIVRAADQITLAGNFSIHGVALWWPHTHGKPHLHRCAIEVTVATEQDHTSKIGVEKIILECGSIGFKSVTMNRSDGRVQLVVNGVPIFCRGACWTINDFMSLTGTPAQLRETLQLAQRAGLNMLRVGGTMVYESEDFYSLCDELGILIWQDFMFANMDYPFNDAAFRDDIKHEVIEQLKRLQKHSSIAIYCGGSEIEQQAAMLGLPASEWSNEFFSAALPQLCAQLHRGIPYFPSTPCEGALPFHVATGVSHYYGVGAYRRPLADLKSAEVKFTSECLGFANVPDAETMELLLDGNMSVPHHPRWKARVPRDNGAGWDFEDIRDHYLKLLFGSDAIELRSRDLDRYYALSRAVSGEVMRNAFAEWRRPDSGCNGGLIWFYKDLWPGAGWGIIDSTNRPKAAYWYLRRAWATQALLITDAGLDGLQLHLINEAPTALNAQLEIALYQHGKIKIGAAQTAYLLPPRSSQTVLADALLPHFFDIAYAYKFGPAKHDVVCARLTDSDSGATISEDFYFPLGLSLPMQTSAKIDASAHFDAAGNVNVVLVCDAFLQSVALTADGFIPNDNYFHLAPQREKQIIFTPLTGAGGKFKVHLSALNLMDSVTLRADRA